jgi:hypothetical protein
MFDEAEVFMLDCAEVFILDCAEVFVLDKAEVFMLDGAKGFMFLVAAILPLFRGIYSINCFYIFFRNNIKNASESYQQI